MIKALIQEDTFVSIYVPNIGTPKYVKQILTDLKGEIDSGTIIVGHFNTPLHQWIDYPDRKPIRKCVGLKQHLRTDDFNRHIQNILSKSNRI